MRLRSLHSTPTVMSLPYPQWWIDQAEQRRIMIASGVETLWTVLPSLPNVRGMLIFGSFARNEVEPESDVDLIVVQEMTALFAV